MIVANITAGDIQRNPRFGVYQSSVIPLVGLGLWNLGQFNKYENFENCRYDILQSFNVFFTHRCVLIGLNLGTGQLGRCVSVVS